MSSGSIKNINEFLDNKKFTFIEGDINLEQNFIVDRIWHLASNPSPNSYQKKPVETLKTSFLGTLNMLNMAKKKQC